MTGLRKCFAKATAKAKALRKQSGAKALMPASQAKYALTTGGVVIGRMTLSTRGGYIYHGTALIWSDPVKSAMHLAGFAVVEVVRRQGAQRSGQLVRRLISLIFAGPRSLKSPYHRLASGASGLSSSCGRSCGCGIGVDTSKLSMPSSPPVKFAFVRLWDSTGGGEVRVAGGSTVFGGSIVTWTLSMPGGSVSLPAIT